MDGVDKVSNAHSRGAGEHFPLRKQESLDEMAFMKDLEA